MGSVAIPRLPCVRRAIAGELNWPAPIWWPGSAVMRTHPALGHAMLAGTGFEDVMLTVVRSHHEMLGG